MFACHISILSRFLNKYKYASHTVFMLEAFFLYFTWNNAGRLQQY